MNPGPDEQTEGSTGSKCNIRKKALRGTEAKKKEPVFLWLRLDSVTNTRRFRDAIDVQI